MPHITDYIFCIMPFPREKQAMYFSVYMPCGMASIKRRSFSDINETMSMPASQCRHYVALSFRINSQQQKQMSVLLEVGNSKYKFLRSRRGERLLPQSGSGFGSKPMAMLPAPTTGIEGAPIRNADESFPSQADDYFLPAKFRCEIMSIFVLITHLISFSCRYRNIYSWIETIIDRAESSAILPSTPEASSRYIEAQHMVF